MRDKDNSRKIGKDRIRQSDREIYRERVKKVLKLIYDLKNAQAQVFVLQTAG